MEITPELAEFCGIHAGDGYLRKRKEKYEVDISGNIEEQEYYDTHVLPLVNKLFKTVIFGKEFFPRGTYGFRTHSKEIARALHEQGFPFGSKTLTVRCPESVLQLSNKKVLQAFLRGFFDTDGCICFAKRYGAYVQYKKEHQVYPRIILTTCSKGLSDDICTILHKLGFSMKCYKRKTDAQNKNSKYCIILNGKNEVNKWMRIIRTGNPVKESKYLLWRKIGFCPPRTTHLERLKILKGGS